MQVMCEVERAIRCVARCLAVAVTLASAASAQEPVIAGESAPSPPEATSPAPAPVAAQPSSSSGEERVPAFTTGAAPRFTPAPATPVTPAPPGPFVSAPAFTPIYAAPLVEPRVVRDTRFTDAHVDRVILVPTAETHPAGTVYLSSYDLVGVQGGYAVGDRTQLTLSFVPPLSRDPVVPLDLTLKTVLVRGPRVRVAAMVSASGIVGLDEGESAIGRVGGVTELCFDDACRSSISTAANLMLAGPALILADGVGAVLRASDLFALLVELQSVLPLSREGGQVNVLAGALGFRLSGRLWAVDLAFEGPLDRRASPPVVPLLIATVRFL
jgi:hypothetical protein